MADLKLTTTQKVPVFVEPVDKFGNPAEVENLVWTSSDPTIVDFVFDTESHKSAWVVTTGGTGSVQIAVTADATLGEGEKPLTAIVNIEVVPAEAVTLGVKFGTPEEKE